MDETLEVKDTKFQKGQSGNPNGRPKGSLNKTTLALRGLIADEAQEITENLIIMAKSGDFMAIKFLLERILPPIKEVNLFQESQHEVVADITKTHLEEFLKSIIEKN